MNRAYSLREKEVINVLDGTRLGYVSDVEINLVDGRIEGIIIPGQTRFFGLLSKENEYIIPWDSVIKVGEDIILVEIDQRTLPSIDNVQHASRRLFCHFSLLSSLPCISKAASIRLENCQNISV